MQEALEKFTSGKDWSIGADAGITVISAGAAGSYDTQTMHKPMALVLTPTWNDSPT
jgi:hypothetical protein